MLLYVLFFLCGACLASFSSLCLFRLPDSGSIFLPGSFCDHCRSRLNVYQLLPLLGWIFRCRKCGKRGRIIYPVAELLSAATAVFLLLALPAPLQGFKTAIFLFFIVLTALLDIKTGDVFPLLSISGTIAGLLFALIADMPPIQEAVPGAASGWLFFFLLRLLTGGGVGAGDADFAALCGAFLGWKMLCCALTTSFLIGGSWGMFMLLSGKKRGKSRVPFTPFLTLGAVGSLLSGNWLFKLFNWT